ncbi:TetR/AcrR family transcriptional regulator [Fodinicola feengrottensis]|uniref:TetR/AcrR family transcriptional regulator n=1 Tax=Fodinicola feengrottensis TaxID=435914 RepID=UPI0024416CAE|nr:TetR/AcrR family transcriptional regulator [Fodinicola feengrottensis]
MVRTVDPVKHEAKRLRILEAAAGCFARKGFESTTTAQLCAAAGISSGSLFHYFPSKRSIFLGIFQQDGRETAERLTIALGSDDSWGAVLALVDGIVSPLAEPELGGLALEVAAQASRDPELAELLVRNDRQLHEGLAVLLERAAAKGQIDGAIPARVRPRCGSPRWPTRCSPGPVRNPGSTWLRKTGFCGCC